MKKMSLKLSYFFCIGVSFDLYDIFNITINIKIIPHADLVIYFQIEAHMSLSYLHGKKKDILNIS